MIVVNMANRRIRVIVDRVEGYCAAGYKPGDSFEIENFYIVPNNIKICLHALSSMLTLISPFLRGYSAQDLGIGNSDHIGYIQCPDPGEPYTPGGRVLFKLVRETQD